MTDYVSDAQARSLILDVGRRLYHSGFVASNDGNITCKVGDNTGRHLQAFQRDQNAPSCV